MRRVVLGKLKLSKLRITGWPDISKLYEIAEGKYKVILEPIPKRRRARK